MLESSPQIQHSSTEMKYFVFLSGPVLSASCLSGQPDLGAFLLLSLVQGILKGAAMLGASQIALATVTDFRMCRSVSL